MSFNVEKREDCIRKHPGKGKISDHPVQGDHFTGSDDHTDSRCNIEYNANGQKGQNMPGNGSFTTLDKDGRGIGDKGQVDDEYSGNENWFHLFLLTDKSNVFRNDP